MAMLLINVIHQHIFGHKLLATLLASELAVTVSNLSFQQILLSFVLGQNMHQELCEHLKLCITKLALVLFRRRLPFLFHTTLNFQKLIAGAFMCAGFMLDQEVFLDKHFGALCAQMSQINFLNILVQVLLVFIV